VPRVLPDNAVAELDANSWTLPPVFGWLKAQANIDAHELSRTFNCGIGMVIVVAEADAAEATRILTENGETVFSIGHIRARQGDEAQSQVKNAAEAWA